MFANLLLPADAHLTVQQIQATPTAITLVLAATAPAVPCPCCQQVTTRRHSSYQRTLADLPWTTRPVRLHLQVRRFFCPVATCPQRIFAERLPALAAPRARKTQRLTDLCQHLGLALGGEAGARLSRHLGLLTSQTTLLRLIRQVPDPPAATPLRVGIDDFAFRKGQTYGTIIIDLDSGDVLDLLPDRTAESVAAWLRAHPTITLITRDRAEVYADGARQGAPQAIQVADRWHLLKNLGETVEEILTQLYPQLCAALAADLPLPTPVPDAPAAAPPVLTDPAACAADWRASPPPPEAATAEVAPPPAPDQPIPLTQQRRDQRRQQYEDIRARHQAGQSLSHIARQLGLDQRTVSKYARREAFPERPATRSGSALDAYREYLAERWAAGCQNKARLWRELRERGYRGGYRSVHNYVTRHYGQGATTEDNAPKAPRREPVRRREWVHRFTQPTEDLTAEEAAGITRVCRHSEVWSRIYDLVQGFGQMVRQRGHAQFDAWLGAALDSGVRELAAFARGLQRDYGAVRAALELSFSNGPTEGHVNKLKVIKRVMYGRAKFDLLRKRVLCAP